MPQQGRSRRRSHLPQGGGSGAFGGLPPLMKVAVLLIAAVVAGVWMYTSRGNSTGPDSESAKRPAAAEVGDCVQNKGSEGSPDMEVIDCGDAKAEYKVASLDGTECEPGQSRYEQTRRGRVQFSMCLTEVSAK
ncbi:LppU/SCO3897 family protein [Streptomyces sp. NPDC003032]